MIWKKSFGSYGYEKISLYILKGAGIEVGITDFGAAVQYIEVDGKVVTLGYADIKSRLKSGTYCGASIGRVANRIKNATFSLAGRELTLDKNDGDNCLHGGFMGFDKRIFTAEIVGESLELKYLSPDGEGGFVGNLEVIVRYTLVDKGLKIEYEGRSDRDTVFAPTNHSYFNLDGKGDIENHTLKVNAKRVLLCDKNLIPTDICAVEGTLYDFIKPTKIGDRQLDNNFCLDGGEAAELVGESGLTLKVYTDMCGLQVYTGDYICGGFQKRSGIALEPQFYPNAVNDSRFTCPHLKAGETKKYVIEYRFEARERERVSAHSAKE